VLKSESDFELADFYGSYRFELHREGESVGIFEDASKGRAFARLDELTIIANKLAQQAVAEIERTFPHVVENPLWVKAKSSFA
jgi:hypothetical protein